MLVKGILKEVYYCAKALLLVIVVSLFITVFVFQPYIVKGSSMEPTFQGADPYNEDTVGDRVFILKAQYRLGSEPKYGDTVVINSKIDEQRTLKGDFLDSPLIKLIQNERESEENKYWIKRVIGEPGDTIEFIDGHVYRNGELLNETYIKEDMLFPFDPVVVPEGHVFLMGDNRNNSYDSRQIGPVPIDHVIGKVFLRFFPFDKLALY